MTSAKEKIKKSWDPEDQLKSYENELNENERALNKLREERAKVDPFVKTKNKKS